MRARLLSKEIWTISDQQWDDPLYVNLTEKFFKWHSNLPILGQLTIPRCYFPSAFDKNELHMFGDSLLEVLCAVGLILARTLET